MQKELDDLASVEEVIEKIKEESDRLMEDLDSIKHRVNTITTTLIDVLGKIKLD